jgi:hypothetical protein
VDAHQFQQSQSDYSKSVFKMKIVSQRLLVRVFSILVVPVSGCSCINPAKAKY